jgi:uncharacterized protein (DUF302 family)
MHELGYGFEVTLHTVDFADAVRRVTEALAAEGFAITCSIDVKAILAESFGVEFRDYLILGACNPTLIKQALDHEVHVGLLLPCNVVIQATRTGDLVVAIADPKSMFTLADNPALASVATEAQRRIVRVVDTLEQLAAA